MNLAYLADDGIRSRMNAEGLNCWEVYIDELYGLMGARSRCLRFADLEDRELLSGVTVLILGAQSGAMINNAIKKNLNDWVGAGGILIGFATRNLYGLFGCAPVAVRRQTPDEYAIAGYFSFCGNHPLTREVHPNLFLEQRQIILSDIDTVYPQTCEEVARLHGTNGEDWNLPAITWRAHGRGFAGYFTFDVAKTVWLLHQGRPLSVEPVCAAKSNTQSLIGQNSAKVPYADELALVIQNMIARRPQPFIHTVPPDGATIPDALFFWSGDEYRGPVEHSLRASDFMRGLGLPYHINIESEAHPMTADQFRHITEDNGHEISVYWKIHRSENADMTEALYRQQSDVFMNRFGVRPGSTLNGQCYWMGWSELPRWMAKAGASADNTFIGINHSIHNQPFFGVGCGTGFPFFFYEDAAHDNRRVPLIEQALTCYELGHRGPVLPYDDKETSTPEEVRLPIDMAVKYHWVINWFYHPVYIVDYPLCRKAIEEITRYIRDSGYRVLHMGANRASDWWHARARSEINGVAMTESGVAFRCDCAWPEGMIVKVPVSNPSTARVICDGQTLPFEARREFGVSWIYLVVPNGGHEVSVAF